MTLPEQQQQLLIDFMRGEKRPFSELYDAVSEQVMLLLLKTRQLCQQGHQQWFAEQHRLFCALCAKSEEIAGLDAHRFPYSNKEVDPVNNALRFMYQIYRGYDEGKHCLQTWGEMNSPPTDRRGGMVFVQPESEADVFIKTTLFSLLLEVDKACSAIPESARQGYSHQDLSLAYSCADTLIARLNAWFAIDNLRAWSEALCNLLKIIDKQQRQRPDWLAPFTDIRASSREIYRYLEKNMTVFSTTVASAIEKEDADILFNQFVHHYGQDAFDWVWGVTGYFRAPYTTPYQWQVKTEKIPEEQQGWRLTGHEEYRCQISIGRENLLELIRRNGLFDATAALADRLMQIYQPATEKNSDVLRNISEEENGHSLSFTGKDTVIRQRAAQYLAEFERWYQHNKTLFRSPKDKRNEKVNVATWLAGLKCYDLKKGIPDGEKLKLKPSGYEQVRSDKHLQQSAGNSDISLQRYHSKVKSVIDKSIDQLIEKQKERNQYQPYNNANFAVKPLWSDE